MWILLFNKNETHYPHIYFITNAMVMSATQVLIDTGSISEDVVKYVLIDYLIQDRAHWKSKYDECIEELHEEIRAAYFNYTEEYEGQSDEEYDILWNGVKDRPEYPRLWREHIHLNRFSDRYSLHVGLCIQYIIGGRNAKERLNKWIEKYMSHGWNTETKMIIMTKIMNSITKRALQLSQ